MRAVVQRVSHANVVVSDEEIGAINIGFLVYLAVGHEDDQADIDLITRKLTTLRVFEDDSGRMARSLGDVGGAILVVSQFTLFGDIRKGRRPSFTTAAPPELANTLYEKCVADLRALGVKVATGRFAANMKVTSLNDGPFTLLIDSKKAL